jgi:outer membrane protein assembly factor BamB
MTARTPRFSLAIALCFSLFNSLAWAEMNTKWVSGIADTASPQAGKLMSTGSFGEHVFLLSSDESQKELFLGKVDALGEFVWQIIVDDPNRDSYAADYRAVSGFRTSMMVDTTGNVVVGYSCGSSEYQSSAGCIVKLDGFDGQVIWRKRVDGYSDCVFAAMPSNHFFRDCIASLQKFDSDGELLWTAPRGTIRKPYGAVSADGDIVSIGRGTSWELVALNSDSGEIRWTRSLEPTQFLDSTEATSLVALVDGSIAVQFTLPSGVDRLYRV